MTKLNNKVIEIVRPALFSALCACLLSCTQISDEEANRIHDVIDTNIGMTREEFKNSLTPDSKAIEAKKKEARKKNSSYSGDNLEPAIPEMSNILATPEQPETIPDKLISISVTDDVPLKDVLIELSRLADIDMEIDPKISGGIILRIKNKPFKDVIERVVDLAGLRYSVENGIMRIERDTPFKYDYKVDFLNLARSTESTMNVDTQSLGGDGSSLPSGSSSSTTSSTDGDIWTSVEEALRNILDFNEEAAINNNDNSVDPLLTRSMQINRQAGIISVIATQRQHESIGKYLTSVARQVSSQVLIEAKVVEVTLDEAYRSGIDWGTLSNQNLGVTLSGNFLGGISTTADFFKISGNSGKNLTTAISFTEAFGTARTLSSPRVSAMNNQQAILSFAENKVYFIVELEEQQEEDNGGDPQVTLNITTELNTTPVGVILALQPSINLDTQEITMHVRPTLSRITGTVSDPGVEIIAQRNNVTVDNDIPVVEVREMDSILKIKSGEIMVIGGLMKDSQTMDDKGVPFLNRVPFAGNLFKSKVQVSEVIETVIFIKATIVENGGVEQADRNLYKNFMSRDPRQLAF